MKLVSSYHASITSDRYSSGTKLKRLEPRTIRKRNANSEIRRKFVGGREVSAFWKYDCQNGQSFGHQTAKTSKKEMMN